MCQREWSRHQLCWSRSWSINFLTSADAQDCFYWAVTIQGLYWLSIWFWVYFLTTVLPFPHLSNKKGGRTILRLNKMLQWIIPDFSSSFLRMSQRNAEGCDWFIRLHLHTVIILLRQTHLDSILLCSARGTLLTLIYGQSDLWEQHADTSLC